MSKQYTWSYSESDEVWQHDFFDTVEECIEDARKNYCHCLEKGDYIAIGEKEEFMPDVDESNVIDNLMEQAYEEVGEVADGWLECKKEEYEKLHDALNKTFLEWMKQTDNEPTFYKIVNIHSVEVQ